MINRENNSFVKNYKNELKNKIIDFYETNSQEDFDLKINDLIFYYYNLLLSENISDYNKISFYNLFSQISMDHFREFILNTPIA
jgi:hypothetical protein